MSAVADTVVAGSALLEIRAVSKRFAGVAALDAVDFSAHAGRGARADGRERRRQVDSDEDFERRPPPGRGGAGRGAGAAVRPRSTQALGLAIIHQKLNQVAELSFCENFFLGRELRGPLRWLAELGLQLDSGRRLGDLRVAECQLLQIAKAMPSMASATSQVSGSHLATFAGDLVQAVVANLPFDANRLVKHLPEFEAFDVFRHMDRVRLGDSI
jgi:hypothetical protein